MKPIPCPLCGAEDERFLFLARDRLHGIAGEFREVLCRGCGLIYLNPRPFPEGMARFYPQEYFFLKESGRSVSKTRIKHRIRDLVLKLYYGYPPGGSPAARVTAAREPKSPQ